MKEFEIVVREDVYSTYFVMAHDAEEARAIYFGDKPAHRVEDPYLDSEELEDGTDVKSITERT